MSKLGLVITGDVDWRRVAAAAPRLVVLRDDAAALRGLHDALGEQTLLVAGTAALGEDWAAFWRGPAGQDVEAALELWLAAVQPGLAAAPFAYWMSFACNVPGSDLIAPYLAFETRRVERLAERGIAACVGNFATGTPDIATAPDAWAEFPTLCRAAADNGGVLGLREFGALYMWTGYGSNVWTGSGFRQERKFPAEHSAAALALRYRALLADVLAPVRLDGLPVAITACGLGHTADAITAKLSTDGKPTGGWQECGPTWRRRDGEQDAADFYLRQLLWYDAQIERDPMVIGAAVFGWGVGGAHELDGRALDGLLDHVERLPRPDGPARPARMTAGLATVKASTPQPAPDRRPEKTYYLRTNHPEIFDALWREGEAGADAAGAFYTWAEVGGHFLLHTDDAAIWQRLYQYGQMLAQQLGAELTGDELRADAAEDTD